MPKRLFPGTLRLVWWTVSLPLSPSPIKHPPLTLPLPLFPHLPLFRDTQTRLSLTLTPAQTDNTEGLRDYELHQHALVKIQYDSLCDVPDVNRCLIMGYSGQNPYVMTYGHNIWQEKFKKERRSNNAKWLSEEERSKRRAEREKRLEAEGAGEDAIGEERERERERVRKARIGVKVDEIIMSNEESETQRLLGDVDPDDMA